MLLSSPYISSKDREHCEMHGIKKHHCFLFSASSDRTIRVWDMFEGKLSCIIDSMAIRYIHICIYIYIYIYIHIYEYGTCLKEN
jgi:WD40 repeat protein